MAAADIANSLFIPNTLERIFGRKKCSKRYCSAVYSSAAPPTTLLISKPRCSSFQLQHHVPTSRRSGNYGPPLWDFNHIQSLNTHYTEKELSSVEELLELIDDLQRLGISYHFEDEINQMLGCLYEQKYAWGRITLRERKGICTLQLLHSDSSDNMVLSSLKENLDKFNEKRSWISLLFFIAEIFDCFRNGKGDFVPSLGQDTKGLLQLYEASFLSTPGEKTIDLAREFATNFLQKNPNEKIDESLSILVRHALELPIHWRVQRPNTRWFIEAYERRADANPLVLEFAKLDFNIVQQHINKSSNTSTDGGRKQG
ncbi:UNVERIFIED_CONTAM: (+)-bornyl diphosphate synthase, chloroplastic [Sesamum calycinum]|uniref:(+)-bornyl diphosphate synthase, chloroplastic n=1 Tax=Sesamum calycinum TaxID=2727403 RepID=A0AAW2PLG0_9LAMI